MAILATINHASKSMLPEAGLYHIRYQLENGKLTGADYQSSCKGQSFAATILAKRSPSEIIGSTPMGHYYAGLN